MNRVGEENKIFTEILSVTSAAGVTGLPIFVGDCDQVNITCGFGTHGSATAITGAVTVNQSADSKRLESGTGDSSSHAETMDRRTKI